MTRRRPDRSGCRFAFWRWSEVSCDGRPYLTRLHLVKTPWFAVFLHWFHAADPQPDPHDHPVSFVSVPLRGGYVERRGWPSWDLRYYGRPWRRFNRVRATDIHRIVAVLPGTLTLVFSGPVVREWGHHTPDGWVPWREYKEARKP